MTRVFRNSCLLLPLLFLIPCVASAKVSVSLRLDRTEATVVDSVKMVVSISGSRGSDSKPVLRGLESFSVTQGGTSSRVKIINGRVNSGIDYTYFIQPNKPGRFEIGPAQVTVEGKTFSSNTATIMIVDQPQSAGVDRGPLFLSAGLSSTKAYIEDQTIYTLKLNRQVRVSDISLALPEVEHLVLKQLGKPFEYQSVYQGKTYQILEVRYALIASKEGNYSIGPTKMSMTVYEPRRRSPRSFFDDPFFSFSTGKPITVASDLVELNVLPLPEEGRPADFGGLVGSFQIESKLEPSEVKAGESATLTVVLSGRGNVNRIPDLKVPKLEQTKVYADQPVLQVEHDDKGLVGSKTMKWALVPEDQGLYEIPVLTVSYFHPQYRRYVRIRTSPHTLSVVPGEPEQVKASADFGSDKALEGPSKQEVKELGRDILPVHASIKDLRPGFEVRPGGLVFWVITLTPVLAYSLALCGMRFRKKSAGAVAATRAKKAANTIVRQYRHSQVRPSDLALQIRNYLNDRFGLSLGSLTPGESAEILRSNGVSLNTAEKLRAVLERLEDAVYTGKAHESCDIGENMPRLIKQIEKEIG